jgi:hypothetical protein
MEISFGLHRTDIEIARRTADGVGRAYRRGDALDKRCKLMIAWANYCGSRFLRQRLQTQNQAHYAPWACTAALRVDKRTTGTLSPDGQGVTVGILHIGRRDALCRWPRIRLTRLPTALSSAHAPNAEINFPFSPTLKR